MEINFDTNTAYAFTQTANAGRSYAVNGLNQYTGVTGGGGAIGYDAHGNLTSFNGNTYTYDGENLMVATSVNSVALGYDPLNRLTNVQRSGLPATLFQYDGDDNIASYDTSNALLRRWVFLPGGGDEPIVWYEGANLTNKRYLQSDERGSIVRVADATNTTISTNSYDDFGLPATTNQDRFQYTGQAWIGNIGLYYYKARFYNPVLGRFMSTDPIGYEGGINLYSYAGSDPINATDPSGTVFVYHPVYACVGDPSGPLSCGYTGYYTYQQDPSGGGVGGNARGGGGIGGRGGRGRNNSLQNTQTPCNRGLVNAGNKITSAGDALSKAGAITTATGIAADAAALLFPPAEAGTLTATVVGGIVSAGGGLISLTGRAVTYAGNHNLPQALLGSAGSLAGVVLGRILALNQGSEASTLLKETMVDKAADAASSAVATCGQE